MRALELCESGELEFAEQPDEGVTYAEKIEASERRLDPGRSAVELSGRCGRSTLTSATYFELEGGERLGVVEAVAECRRTGPGRARGRRRARFCSGPADGALRIAAVKPAGKREMAAADYLRGNPSPRLAS